MKAFEVWEPRWGQRGRTRSGGGRGGRAGCPAAAASSWWELGLLPHPFWGRARRLQRPRAPPSHDSYGLGDDLRHHSGGAIPKSCGWRLGLRRFMRGGRRGSAPTPPANRNMHAHSRAITLGECDKGKLNVKSAVNSR